MDEELLIGGGIGAAVLALIVAAMKKRQGQDRGAWQALRKSPGAYGASSLPTYQSTGLIQQAIAGAQGGPQPRMGGFAWTPPPPPKPKPKPVAPKKKPLDPFCPT